MEISDIYIAVTRGLKTEQKDDFSRIFHRILTNVLSGREYLDG